MNAMTRKLIRDYTYHMDSLEDILSISCDAESDFREAMNDGHEDALEALQPKEGSVPPKKIEEIDEVKFEDKDFKKIFRKLAVKCHPDKLTKDISERESNFLKKCYEDMNLANLTYDWGLLLKVANELDVEITDLSEAHFDNINSNIESIKRKISMYENSMAYKWYTLSDPEIKKGYLETCAAIFMKSVNKD
jgi:hypothetical protein|tara:strand:- start:2423 stop:2998 length:576 start_codon:yes stop_codon:yes gene_type:complete